jgi:hypothetical protein
MRNCFENGTPDQFGYLRHYGVSESGKALWNIGYPIMPSTNSGFGKIGSSGPSRKTSRRLLKQVPLPKYRPFGEPLLSALFVGVGKKPNSVPPMPGPKVGSRNAVPLRIIPDLGQVSENAAKPSAWLLARATKQVCDVLHEEEGWCHFVNQSGDFGPKAAAFSLNASSSASDRQVLARKAAGNDIGSNSIGSKALCGKFPNVSVEGDLGPVLGEDFARELFDLAEGDGFKSACSFKAKAKASYSAEKVKNLKFGNSPGALFRAGGDNARVGRPRGVTSGATRHGAACACGVIAAGFRADHAARSCAFVMPYNSAKNSAGTVTP